MKKGKKPFSNTNPPATDGPSEGGQKTKLDAHVEAIREVAAEPREGDGIDPRLEAKQRRAPKELRLGFTHGVHQQERLASQIERTLDLALQAAANPVLNALTVTEVAKAGGSLAVVLVPRNPEDRLDVSAATEAVNHAATMLRREVAAAITRKEVPNLTFVVLPGGAERMGD